LILEVLPVFISTFLVGGFYALFAHFLFHFKAKLPKDKTKSRDFSIVICLRNEEKNVPTLLRNLSALKYSGKFEILLIDDNSTDLTVNLLLSGLKKLNNAQILSAKEKRFPNKKGALDIGINNAKYEFIALTDADCAMPVDWLEYLNAGFESGADIVFAPTPLRSTGSFWGNISQYESFRNHFVMFGSANIHFPYTATAGNLSYNKQAILGIGGYSNTVDSLGGDDDLLIREAVKNKLKIYPLPIKEAAISTYSKTSYAEYIKQKSRHISTSHHYLFKHKLYLAVWYLSQIIPMLLVPFVFIHPLYIVPFWLKCTLESGTALLFSRRLGFKIPFYRILMYPLFFEIFPVLHFVNSLRVDKEWK